MSNLTRFIVCQIFSLVSFCENVADSKQNRHNHHSLEISAPEVRCARVIGPRFESPRAVVFITTAAAIYSLGHGLQTFTAVPRSTQPFALRGTVNEYQLSGWVIIKWRWWMWMVAAYRRIHRPSRLAWSEGWQPSGAESAFIKWTGWTLAVAQSHDDSTIVICIIIIIIFLVSIATG